MMRENIYQFFETYNFEARHLLLKYTTTVQYILVFKQETGLLPLEWSVKHLFTARVNTGLAHMDLVKESQKQHYDFVMTEYGMGLQN